MQFKTFIALSIVFLICTSAGAKGEAQLTQVLAPGANWLNPVDGTMIEFTLTASVEVEDDRSIMLLVGLPFTPTTTPTAMVRVADESCDLEDMSWSSGSVWTADTSELRTMQDGLTYYWVSTSTYYEDDAYIDVCIGVTLNGESGFNDPLDVALTTSTDQYYMIVAQNTNVNPIYQLDVPDTLTIEDGTDSGVTADSVLGSTFTGTLNVNTGAQARRFYIMISGYSFNSNAPSDLVVTYTDDEDNEYEYVLDDEIVAELDDGVLTIKLVNETAGVFFEPGDYALELKIDVPDSPTSASFDIYTMDKYGPQIIEEGSLASVFTSTSVGWQSNYPKVSFSYGFDASSSDVKETYGLYTSSGTSMVYNHLVFAVKQSSYDIPDGSQTLEIVVGSSSNPATCADGTVETNIAAASGSTVSCACGSSTTTLTCSGINLAKSVEGKVAIKIAYAATSSISGFGDATLMVDSVTIVEGSPSLKDNFNSPIMNTSPINPSSWSEYITSSVASCDPVTTLTSSNFLSAAELSNTYNGLRQADGQYLYMKSRIGPYSYYTASEVNVNAAPENIFFEITVSKDIETTYDDTDPTNGIFYLAKADELAQLIVSDFYWDSDNEEGWLYYAVDRPLCDADLDGSSDSSDTYETCVSWYCYEDADGDGSYDSPQPCKPVRACTSTGTTSSLWYPEVMMPFHNIDTSDYKMIFTSDNEHIAFDSSLISDWTLPSVAATRTDNLECRPVRECDISTVTAGTGVYYTSSSYGDDCVRSTDPFCNLASNADLQVLDDYDSDGSGVDSGDACNEVPACDIDFQSEGTTESRLDGAYCNPFKTNDYITCNIPGSLDSMLIHGTEKRETASDCISMPLCTATESGTNPYDFTEWLSDLAESDSYCVPVPSDSVCTDFVTTQVDGSNEPTQTLNDYPGLGVDDADSTSCVFLSACNAAPSNAADEEWITDDRVDNRACSLMVPYCNIYNHIWNVNAPLFLGFSDRVTVYSAMKGLMNSVYTDTSTGNKYPLSGAGGVTERVSDGKWVCIELDACDTFNGGQNRERADEKACYKAVSLGGKSHGNGVAPSWGAAKAFNVYTANFLNNSQKYQNMAFNTASNTQSYEGINQGYCNAMNDDGDSIYMNIWGEETDCSMNPEQDVCADTNQRRTSWGIIQSASANGAGLVPGSTACIWQIPCTVRTTKQGDIDGMNGWDCYTIDSDSLCTSNLSETAAFTRVDSSTYTLYESIGTDSACIITPSCYFNAWIADSKYYMHAKGFKDEGNYIQILGKSFPNWYQYSGTSDELVFITEGCIINYDSSSISYSGPADLSSLTALTYSIAVSFKTEKRRLAVDYGNEDDLVLNVPADFLFVEDLVSDSSFSTTNPIEAVHFDDSNDVYNIFKFQLANIEAGYVAAPMDDDDTTSMFTVQTWNLVFFDPLHDEDQTSHNFFAFTGVNILTSAVNRLTADYTDYYVQDLFWAVYFDASTDEIDVALTDTADISGLENLVIYTNYDDTDNLMYFGAGGLSWTTYSYKTNGDLSGNFLNVFVLYGNTLGTETDLSVASELVIFFDSAEGVEEDLDCTSKGLTQSGCSYTEAIGDTSVSVTYYTEDRSTTDDESVYNSLYRSRVGISVDSVDDASFSVIFPFEAGDTSSKYLTMGLMDGSNQLQYLSARGNENNFAPGQGARKFYTTSDGDSILSITTSDATVQEIYEGDDSNAPTSYAWIEIPADTMIGTTVETTFNAVLDYNANSNDGGFSGVMFCATYDFQGGDFAFELDTQTNADAITDPNFYGCWDAISYDDMSCVLCNTDGESGDFNSPYTITVTDFVIPSEAGLTFPADTVTVVFNSDGEADSILLLEMAGDIFSENTISLITTTTTINRAHSQMISFTLNTEYGIPSGSTIKLSLSGDEGGMDISVEKEDTTPDSICYIDDSSCSFSVGTNIEIDVSYDIAAGDFTVNLYGLYATSAAESSAPTTENYALFDLVEVTNSAGDALYVSEADASLTINYGSASYEITVTDIMLKKDNEGWNTMLMFYIETDKDIYEGDYIFINIANYAPTETPECNIWNDDEEVSMYFDTCDFVSFSSITLTPSVDDNSNIQDLGFWVSLNNIDVSDELDDSTITVSLMYNEGVTALTSETEDLPSRDSTAADITLTATIDMDYVGIASTVTLTFDSPVDIEQDDEIYIAFSTNYGYTLGEGMFYVTINDESISVETTGYNAIETQGVPSAISNGETVTIVIEGIDSPNIASGEERTFMVGIEDSSNSDDNTLVAVGSTTTTADVTDLSTVDLIYPRFQELTETSTRMDTDITFDVEVASAYDVGYTVYARLNAAGYAVTQAGSVSCSIEGTSDGAEYAENCEISNNVISFTLKSALTAGDTYTFELGGLPNPDWETCEANVISLEIYNSGSLVAASAPGLYDNMALDIEEADYSVEVDDIDDRLDDIELPIGFYTEIVVRSSEADSIFYDELTFSVNDKSGYVSLNEDENVMAYVGYDEATLTLGVSSSAFETMSTLILEADSEDIARAPVIPYELEMEVEEIEVNSGTSLTVETLSTTAPLSVCIDDLPVDEFDADITIEATDSLEDPMLTVDVDSITLSATSNCAFITISAESEEATVDRTATLTITPNTDIFETYTAEVTVVEATSTTTTITVSNTDPAEYSFIISVEANQQSTVGVYLAPEVDFLLGDSYDVADFEALLDGSCVLSADSTASLEVYTDTAVEFSYDDLLRNTEYRYASIAIGAGSDVAINTGYITTAAGDIPNEAASYDCAIYDLTDDMKETLICDLATAYGLPTDDITGGDGETCPTDDDDTNECNVSDTTDNSDSMSSMSDSMSDSMSSSASVSSSAARLLQASSSSDSMSMSSSSSEEINTSDFTYRILPPTRSWVPDYVSEPEDAATTLARLEDLEDYEIASVSEPYTVTIEEVSSVSSPSTSVTETSFTVSGLYPLDESDDQVAGSVCYAIFLGTVEASVSQIADGATDDQDAIMAECQYLSTDDSLTIEYTGADSDTDYTISYYAKSIDTREYSTTTDAVNTSVRTEAVVEEEEEEESGYLTSIAFLTLLVALFFNF